MAETNVVPEVPCESSCDSAMKGVIEEGCVILSLYTCSGPDSQTSTAVEVAPTGLSPTLGENKWGIPIDDGDVDMGVEPVEPPTKRHSPPRPHIQHSTPHPPMSPSPAGPVHLPRHIDRPTNINMVFPGIPTPAPTPSLPPAPRPPILPVSINMVPCGIPSPASTPVPAPTPKLAPTSQPMSPTRLQCWSVSSRSLPLLPPPPPRSLRALNRFMNRNSIRRMSATRMTTKMRLRHREAPRVHSISSSQARKIPQLVDS